jgi:hypothetical protein
MNTYKVHINHVEQTVITSAVLCTKDVELYISMLICPR